MFLQGVSEESTVEAKEIPKASKLSTHLSINKHIFIYNITPKACQFSELSFQVVNYVVGGGHGSACLWGISINTVCGELVSTQSGSFNQNRPRFTLFKSYKVFTISFSLDVDAEEPSEDMKDVSLP